ncbi:MAG: hypothetical protein WCS96_03290 [Victivallales bacterium]
MYKSIFAMIVTVAVSQTVFAEHKALDNRDAGIYRMERPEYSTGILKVDLSETPDPARKKVFWEGLRAKAESGNAKRMIYQLNFTRPDGWKYKLPPIETAKKQIDAWFRSDDNAKTSPELIFAVTPDEENISWNGQPDLMNQIGDYIRSEFRIPVYQWFTEPLPPSLEIRADGWVLDPYSVATPSFYSHLEAYILYGKPVVPMLWASGHFNYGQPAIPFTFAELTRSSHAQMDYCRALKLPVIIFAVTQKPWGSVPAWFGKAETPEEQQYRDFFKKYLAEMQTSDAPAVTVPEKRIWLVIQPDGTGREAVNLKEFVSARDTVFDSPYSWLMTKEGLKLRAASGKLAWNLSSSGKINEAQLILKYRLAQGKAKFAGTELLREETEIKVALGDFEKKEVALEAEGELVLQSLEIVFKGKFEKMARELRPGKDGALTASAGFEDDSFMSSLIAKESRHSVVEISRNGIIQRGASGYASSSVLTQEITLPGDRGIFKVKANIYASSRNYASSVKAILSFDGKTSVAEAMSDPEKNWQDMEVTLNVPSGAKQVYLTWILSVSCGVATPAQAPAYVKNYKMEFVK